MGGSRLGVGLLLVATATALIVLGRAPLPVATTLLILGIVLIATSGRGPLR
jgi:hypothetical protein